MFDERKARRVTGFIECLKHTKGEFHGKPLQAAAVAGEDHPGRVWNGTGR